MSESMTRQRQHVPAFRRAASAVKAHCSEDRLLPTDMDTNNLLKLAKDNIEMLKEKGKRVCIERMLFVIP